YSLGEYKGLPYIEMEFIDGKSLETIIAETDRLPPVVCSAIGIFIARALVYAHSQEYLIYGKNYHGIIHRDLKPANIMISKVGDVKLMDFGIARPKEASLHTVEGNIVGTMQYLSPEQLDGVDIDTRTDIYSFGAILYEMLTGTKTFPQDTITNLMKKKITNEYRKFSEFDFHVPSVLAKISQKCLQLDKKDRYPTAESLLKDLEAAHRSLTSETPEEIIKRFIADPYSFKTSGKVKFGFALRIPLKVAIPIAGVLLTAIAIGVFIITGPVNEEEISSIKKDTSLVVSRDTVKKDSITVAIKDTLRDADTKGQRVDSSNIPKPPPDTKIGGKGGTGSGGKIPPPKPPLVIKKDTTVRKDTLEELRKKYGKEDIIELTITAMRSNELSIVPFLISKIPDYESTKKKILLLEFYLLTGRLNEAEGIASENINDAHFEYLRGKLYEKRGNLSMALGFYERALTKPSALRNAVDVRNDALYETANIRTIFYRSNPNPDTRLQALSAWNSVKRNYMDKPNHPRFQRANVELSNIQ
ncbi:MAG: serine/threonine protein kinase, partial [Chitinispirillaceae bacterium]|nr:serine/threonine protein kinase [Chitinispirillaceae bacterium]